MPGTKPADFCFLEDPSAERRPIPDLASARRDAPARTERENAVGGAVGVRFLVVLLATLLCCCRPAHVRNETAASRVEGVSTRIARRLTMVRTASVTLVTTPEHPFAKVAAGWTRAADLKGGDRVQTAGGGITTVGSVEVRDVPPTVVHNLTVSRTHAYFVGSQALLVHNTDCGGPPSPTESRVRPREEEESEQRERFRARRAQRRAQLDAARREREQRRMLANPFNDMPNRPNCSLCALAGLSDVDRLSSLVRDRNLDVSDPNGRLSIDQSWNLLIRWGLRNQETPPARQFPPTRAETDEARRKVALEFTNGKPSPRFSYQDQAKEHMATSSANTFFIAFEFLNHGVYDGHALLGVKRHDGSIIYVDLQNVPPTLHDDLDPRIYAVAVLPTSVDWRTNQQLANVVKNGVHVPLAILPIVEPTTPPVPSSPEPFDVDDLFASDPEDAASP